MEEIEAELEQKSIERVESVIKEVKEQVLVEPPAKAKPKRARSQKQIEAFEKAKLKRAENLRLKKEQKEKDKLEKKTKIKEFKKELDSDPPQREQAEQSKPNSVRVQEKNVSKPVIQTPASAPNSREQVIQNHYYYYGVPPPQQEHSISKSKKKKKSKKPPTPPSSESESESSDEEYYHEPKSPPVEPESYKELQSIPKPTPRRQNPKSSLKFGFA